VNKNVNKPGINVINLYMCGFFAQMTKKLKSHFTKHFLMKFGEVDAEKNCSTCETAISLNLFAIRFLPKFDEIDPWRAKCGRNIVDTTTTEISLNRLINGMYCQSCCEC
jgi:hypothetical protein